MPQPIVVTIPHRLGKDEAKRRLQVGFSNVRSHVSNSFVTLKDAWAGDHLHFQANLLGQSTIGRWTWLMITCGSKCSFRGCWQCLPTRPRP